MLNVIHKAKKALTLILVSGWSMILTKGLILMVTSF